MQKEITSRKRKSRLQLLHQYYQYTGFYNFIGTSIKKAIIPFVLVVAVLFLVHTYVINFYDVLEHVTTSFSPVGIFSVFFASEAILGLVPPEIFIAWAGKTATPVLYLGILALLSYLGGVASYFTGIAILKIPAAHQYIEVKMAKQIKNIRKWGGFLIIVGALLPVPFAITSLAAGLIRFNFGAYLLYGLLRFVRFAIYGFAIFSLV